MEIREKLSPSNNDSLVSVIMSIYSEPEEWIKEAIESVVNQTYVNLEYLIVNDNPTRSLNLKIINEFRKYDDRIRVINNKENLGLTRSLNIAINLSKGKYLARMDADDISYTTRLENQVRFMELNPDVVVCGTNISYFGQEVVNKVKWIKFSNNDLKNRLFTGSCFAHPTVMIRKEILVKSNVLYDESYIYGQDYKLWVDLANKGEYCNLPEILLYYRKSTNQISSNKAILQKKNSYLARKQYFYNKLKGYDSTIEFDLPDLIRYDTYNDLIKIESFCKKNKFYNNSVRVEFTHMFNSLICHTQKIDIKLFMLFFIHKIVFRREISFYEIFRLFKRSLMII